MSWTRAAVIVAAAALGAAALLALIARAPEAVRRTEVPRGATDPRLGDSFTAAQVARHGEYRRAGYAAFSLRITVVMVTLVVLCRGPMARLVAALEVVPGGWAVRAALAGAATALLLVAAGLPVGFVHGYINQHAWGLATQDIGAWASDRLRSAALSAVMAAVAAVAFFGVVRWQPRTWWGWGWLVFTALNAAAAFLWPLVVAPLFNRFTPLEDGSLRQRVVGLADAAGIDVGEVLVADASRRSTIENAYVAGFGGSKRIVLYDTLVSAGGERETEFVVAHELGHRIERHVVKNLMIASAGLAAGFGALLWLSARSGPWSWAGAAGIGDLRALPLLVLLVLVANLVALPVETAISRRFEARADEIALELTGDPDTAVRVFRRLAFSNLADLRPPAPVRWFFFHHPPPADRIRAAIVTGSAAP